MTDPSRTLDQRIAIARERLDRIVAEALREYTAEVKAAQSRYDVTVQEQVRQAMQSRGSAR